MRPLVRFWVGLEEFAVVGLISGEWRFGKVRWIGWMETVP